MAAVVEEARQEPAPVEPVAPEVPIEEAAPAAVPVEPLATEAFSPESKAVTISGDEADKFKYSLDYIEGIGPAYAARLNAIGITTLHDLLEKGAFPKGREEIATAAGISHCPGLEVGQSRRLVPH